MNLATYASRGLPCSAAGTGRHVRRWVAPTSDHQVGACWGGMTCHPIHQRRTHVYTTPPPKPPTPRGHALALAGGVRDNAAQARQHVIAINAACNPIVLSSGPAWRRTPRSPPRACRPTAASGHHLSPPLTMTSMCSQSAPRSSMRLLSSASRAKSDDRMDGAMAVAGRSRPGATADGRGTRVGAMVYVVCSSVRGNEEGVEGDTGRQ